MQAIRLSKSQNNASIKPIPKFSEMIKLIGGIIVYFGCLTSCVLMFLQARHYQAIGQKMPNWKGGYMEPSDGYTISAAFLLLSVASLVFLVKCFKKKKGAGHGNSAPL